MLFIILISPLSACLHTLILVSPTKKSWFRNPLEQADVLSSLAVLQKEKKMVAGLLWKKTPSHTVGVLIVLENEI